MPSDPYPIGPDTKWYVVVARGAIACRWGPIDGGTVGKIMTQCLDEKIPASFVADCGPEFDWSVARDLARIPRR